MKELTLKTPTKDAKLVLFDEASREDCADDSATDVEGNPEDSELEDLRKQFAGDIHITEGPCHCHRHYYASPTERPA